MRVSTTIACIFLALELCAQDGLQLKDLTVPNGPAFILTDITPTLAQSPNTPKKFILGLAQSFEKSSGGFPDNYSAEFTPYWFLRPGGRSIYSAAGLQNSSGQNGKLIVNAKEDIFSGLKFTGLSIAFINKDLISDKVDLSHKVVALGLKTTLIKVQQPGYADEIEKVISDWHKTAQADLAKHQTATALIATQEDLDRMTKAYSEKKENTGAVLQKKISELMTQKPVFSWDFAGAYAGYGIANENWQSGRSGVWTTVSTYLPLKLKKGAESKNYLNLNLSSRVLRDNFSYNEFKEQVKTTNWDTGGKAALDFEELSIGVESLYRYTNGKNGSENRTVGVINYKIAENIFLSGAFGKNFESQPRSVAMFGINWGIGSEKALLPALK